MLASSNLPQQVIHLVLGILQVRPSFCKIRVPKAFPRDNSTIGKLGSTLKALSGSDADIKSELLFVGGPKGNHQWLLPGNVYCRALT
jgi:hypothetical protein